MIAAGRINKLFGTEGSVMISLYDAFPGDFTPGDTPLFVLIDELEVPLWCDTFERRGMTNALVRFADFDSDLRAQELLGREFFIAESGRDDDEFYLEDLIGFAVTAGTHRGRLTDYYDSEANPLFGITFEGRDTETLVPAAEEFIARIDFERRTIRMVLPEGLLDL